MRSRRTAIVFALDPVPTVTLRPRPGYIPKSLSTPFKAQVIFIPVLSSELSTSHDADNQSTVCPVNHAIIGSYTYCTY